MMDRSPRSARSERRPIAASAAFLLVSSLLGLDCGTKTPRELHHGPAVITVAASHTVQYGNSVRITDFSDINAAIHSARPGDTVMVYPGTYSSPVPVFPPQDHLHGFQQAIINMDRTLVLRAAGEQSVTLEVPNDAVGIYCQDVDSTGEVSGFTIRGFTIVGIWCMNASPLLYRNRIVANGGDRSLGFAMSGTSRPRVHFDSVEGWTSGFLVEHEGHPDLLGVDMSRIVEHRPSTKIVPE